MNGTHWERGYRVHVYWKDGSNERLGRVELSPRGRPIYFASLDTAPLRVWEYKTLAAAKRRVERELTTLEEMHAERGVQA